VGAEKADNKAGPVSLLLTVIRNKSADVNSLSDLCFSNKWTNWNYRVCVMVLVVCLTSWHPVCVNVVLFSPKEYVTLLNCMAGNVVLLVDICR